MYILEIKFDLEIEIFKVKGVCENFFYYFLCIQRIVTSC